MIATFKNTAFGIAVCAVTSLTAVSAYATSTANTMVDLELALLVDVSGSIDDTEFALQKQGYVNAFKSAAVQNAIEDGTNQAIAVSMMYWSAGSQQDLAIDWTLVTDASDFADLIDATTRPFNNTTAPGSAINAITPTFDTNLFDAMRQVIDVSGDGIQNAGADTSDARDAALLAGVDAINGITIGDAAGLGDWYNANIKGGDDAFVLQASSFMAFEDALKTKLVAEITDTPPAVPLPAPALLLIAGLGTLGAAARKRKAS